MTGQSIRLGYLQRAFVRAYPSVEYIIVFPVAVHASSETHDPVMRFSDVSTVLSTCVARIFFSDSRGDSARFDFPDILVTEV